MELQLPKLRGFSRGHIGRARPNPILHRRRLRYLVGTGHASPDVLAQLRANPDLQPGRAIPRQRRRRDRPGRRTGRSHHRTLYVARIGAPMAHLVHRQRLLPISPSAIRCSACSSSSAAWIGAASISTTRASTSTACLAFAGAHCPSPANPLPIRPTATHPSPATIWPW